MATTLCAAAAALLVGPGETVAGGAAAPAQKPLRLSLERALALADERNPSYRLARAAILRAEGARLGALPRFPANPYLSFDLGPRILPGPDELAYQLRLEQPLDVFNKRRRRIRAADAEIAKVRAETEVTLAQVLARVKAVYVDALLVERRRSFAEQRVKVTELTYEAAKLRARLGSASEIEHRIAEAELGRAKLAVSAAITEHQGLLAELRTLLDLEPGQPLVLTTPLGPPPERTMPLSELVERARVARRDLRFLRQRGRALAAEAERLRAERLPLVSAALSVQRDLSVEHWVGLGLTITPSLWQRNQGPIAANRAEQRQNRVAVHLAERALERELAQALLVARQRRADVQLLETSVLRAAERTRELVFEGWRAGKFDIFRLMQAQRELVDVQLNYLARMAALWRAEIEIDRALGILGMGGAAGQPGSTSPDRGSR